MYGDSGRSLQKETYMIRGKFNVLLDQSFGSSGKGKMSAWLTDRFGVTHVSSSNFANAGHSVVFSDGMKFVAKAIPTAAALKRAKGLGMQCFISPGSGFSPEQMIKEWDEAGRPNVFVHSRANIVTAHHAERERNGSESTKHIASTMQGTATAISDKILRRPNVMLTGNVPWLEVSAALGNEAASEARDKIRILDALDFRTMMHEVIGSGTTWFHEGSQGYALSIDHGFQYPMCTSRNCTLQAAMDQMAVPPGMVGDVYLNLRTFPIRVGNVVEDGKQVGYSGDFYPDSRELTWEQIGQDAGMPPEEIAKLAENERTTVTKRIRRVSTFSFEGLKDAVRVNGATKLCVNFVQYLDWNDKGLKGGREAFEKLSKKTREFIDRVEAEANVPVVLVGTGASHDDIISLL